MVHLEFGQDRLAQPHPLNSFELAQGAIKVPLEACFVTQQVIELGCERNVLPKGFQLHPLGFHRGARFLVALQPPPQLLIRHLVALSPRP